MCLELTFYSGQLQNMAQGNALLFICLQLYLQFWLIQYFSVPVYFSAVWSAHVLTSSSRTWRSGRTTCYPQDSSGKNHRPSPSNTQPGNNACMRSQGPPVMRKFTPEPHRRIHTRTRAGPGRQMVKGNDTRIKRNQSLPLVREDTWVDRLFLSNPAQVDLCCSPSSMHCHVFYRLCFRCRLKMLYTRPETFRHSPQAFAGVTQSRIS